MEDRVKIMVVDDEPSIIESFKMILNIKDYDVFAFSDGASAIATVASGKYDVAFVDMKLLVGEPGPMRGEQGGIELLKKIKEIDASLEVVIVTAFASDQTKANAITLGALEYLSKPFLMEEIYELVERGLRRRREKTRKKEGPAAPPPSVH